MIDYLANVIWLLEKLALLVYVLGGQPAQGTELFTLQLQNSLRGLLRGFFIENGLGSFVTEYHKGYSISGSVKIIHCYLPAAVTEILVYYMIIVKPLCDQLEMLVLERPQPEPTFLWVVEKEGKNVPWPSTRLTDVLAREFRQHLNTKANILLWRHTAIAISPSPWPAQVQKGLQPRAPGQADYVGRHADRTPRALRRTGLRTWIGRGTWACGFSKSRVPPD